MSFENTVNNTTIREWINAKLSPQTVESTLQSKGMDAISIENYLKEFKKQRGAKRQFTGFIWLGIGAFLGFFSCVMTLTHAIPILYDVILYGLTMVAIIMILVGFYFVFED